MQAQNGDFPGATSIYAGIKQTVERAGGTATLSTDGSFTAKPDVALLQQLRSQRIPIASVFLSGRPLWINPELNASDAFVAAWLPGSEGGGIADVLFASQVWPALTTIRQPIPAMSAVAGSAHNRQPASQARSRRAKVAARGS